MHTYTHIHTYRLGFPQTTTEKLIPVANNDRLAPGPHRSIGILALTSVFTKASAAWGPKGPVSGPMGRTEDQVSGQGEVTE